MNKYILKKKLFFLILSLYPVKNRIKIAGAVISFNSIYQLNCYLQTTRGERFIIFTNLRTD